MNARRATWILLAVVVAFCLGVTEIALRSMFSRQRWLDPAEDPYWYTALIHTTKRTTEGEDVEHHPQLGWRMRANHEKNGARTNVHHMRGTTDYPVERVEGKKRIMAIGDSYTYGLGVKDEDTFSAILESSRDDLEVLNCGTNGWGTDQSFLDYTLHRKKFDPDVIVVGIYEDDYNRNGVGAREYLKPRYTVANGELVLGNVPIPPPEELDPSTLPDFERLRLLDVSLWAYQLVRWNVTQKHQLDGPFEEKAEILHAILRDLKKAAAEGGRERPIVLLTWPTMFFEEGHDSARIRGRVLEIAKSLDIPAYDLNAALLERQAKDGKPIYDPKSSHWSRAGHEVAAEQIRRHLVEIGYF